MKDKGIYNCSFQFELEEKQTFRENSLFFVSKFCVQYSQFEFMLSKYLLEKFLSLSSIILKDTNVVQLWPSLIHFDYLIIISD